MYSTAELAEMLRAVPAPSIVGVGDDVLDCYLHEDLAYPGGNALNVAVYSRLFFRAESAFVGIVGTDRYAEHLLSVLDDIGVDHTRARRAQGPNGMAFVSLDAEGDRRFVGSNYGGVQHGLRLRVTPQDLDFLQTYDRVHTSVYSAIETELPSLAERGVKVSYDFSDDAPASVIEKVGSYVDVGFFSGGSLSDADVDALGAFAVECGVGVAIVTLGSRGARAYAATTRASAGILPVDAVDALGAGDAFITGFLAARASGEDLDGCLRTAATSGALACMQRGAFGYPVEAGEEAKAQLIRRYDPVV